MQTGCAKGPAVNLWRQAVGQAGGERDFLSWRLPHLLRGRTLSASPKRTHPLDRYGGEQWVRSLLMFCSGHAWTMTDGLPMSRVYV